MNRFSQIILPAAALVVFAGSLFAADTIELKQRWIAGKKYYQTIETTNSSTLTIGGQTIDQSTTMTMDTSEAVRPLADGSGKRMTLKYDRVAADMSMGGQKMSYDSSKPGEGPDPLGFGKAMGSVTGKELQVLLNEKDEITALENYDEFVKQLGAPAMPGMDLSKMFTKEAMTQIMKGAGLQAMPDHPVKPGDSWPYTMNIELPQLGKITMTGTYTFKGMADREGIPCAEILADAKVSMDLSGTDASTPTGAAMAALGMKVKEGAMKGTVWFDPKLGLARESQMAQDLILTMKNPTDPSATITIPSKQIAHKKLTKVEDLK